jgi:hypothetical protein
MTLKEKRKNRKLAKLYGRLGGYTLLYWILQLVTLIVIRNRSEGDWTPYMIPILIAIVVPVFVSLGFWMVSQGYQGALIIYRNQIKEFRVRRAFQKCMEYIEAGDLDMARNIYNDYIPTKHPTRDYLYSLLIWLMSKSEDPELKKTGVEKVTYLKEFYHPAKINF